MKNLPIVLLLLIVVQPVFSQTEKLWSEKDRKYLVGNLKHSIDSLKIVTRGLSKAQWTFKESPKSWSIAEVVEHLAIFELIFEREIGMAIAYGPQPDLAKNARSDSAYLAFLNEETAHITTEYTKPFTYTVPMGLSEGKNSLEWLSKMYTEAVNYVDTTKLDLKVYFVNSKSRSAHQRFLVMFGHMNRHLRQINRIKSNPKFPKK